MELSIEKEGGKTLVKLTGRVDTTNAADFQQALQPLMEDPQPDIVMDCSDMEYTSSQGLRIFLMLQKHVTACGGSLVLVGMRENVKEVFDITGFSNIIKIL